MDKKIEGCVDKYRYTWHTTDTKILGFRKVEEDGIVIEEFKNKIQIFFVYPI
jgi:hypothetical protein